MRLRRALRITVVAALVVLGVIAVSLVAIRWWGRVGAGEDAPRIGLSVSDAWYDDLGFHRAPYDVALARAGARVVSLRPSDDANRIDEAIADLDGLLLTGGGDVAPSIYGGTSTSASLVDVARDRFELELLKRAEARGLPVVAICRGIQVLAVAYGGDVRDLRPDEELADTHGIGPRRAGKHDVDIAPETRLAGILGAQRLRVNSTHFHAVAAPGRLRVCARSPDGVIEAVELPGERLVLGIQWHPELLGIVDASQQAVIEHLVAAAREFRVGKNRGQ
jgi:putative glutamine amidotransferase